MSSSIIRTPNNQDSTPEEHPDGDAPSIARSVAKHVTDDDGQRPVTLDERLADWSAMARGAFAANTVRAWRSDWEIFGEFCRNLRLEVLPAAPKTVREFVFECLSINKKPATIRRYVSTIGRAHRASAGGFGSDISPKR